MSSAEWKKENTVLYGLRIAKSTGIPEAINYAAVDHNKKPIELIREAVIEKLTREGYLPESPKNE